MDADRSLEWVRSMRLQLLDSLCELSSIHLQTACWTNPNNANPHFSLVEFVETSPFRTTEALEHEKASGVITETEYKVLAGLAVALAGYSPPNNDWYNHEAVLKDPAWHRVTEAAASALSELLALSFNSAQWLGK